MTNDEIIEKMNGGLPKIGGLKKSIMFDFGDDGHIHVSGLEAVAEKKEADCTIVVSKSDFMDLVKRKRDPLGAFMSGDVKLKGDKSVAMGLLGLFKSM